MINHWFRLGEEGLGTTHPQHANNHPAEGICGLFLSPWTVVRPFHVKHKLPTSGTPGIFCVVKRPLSRRCALALADRCDVLHKVIHRDIHRQIHRECKLTVLRRKLIGKFPALLRSHLGGARSKTQAYISAAFSSACDPRCPVQHRLGQIQTVSARVAVAE